MADKDILLAELLGCGYADVDVIFEAIDLLEKMGGDSYDPIERLKDEGLNLDFSTLLSELYIDTMFLVAEEIKYKDELEDKDEIVDYLEDEAPGHIFINYLDSWYGLESLDYPADTKSKIVAEVIEEVREKL